uniref:Uncharacterized protein n=1 Tax=Globisporangium ultimum (strain ATCC 200006 / CBS 805.95 / DAOM BR144) TaxID=431595 RepID=K3WGL9_GLOUD
MDRCCLRLCTRSTRTHHPHRQSLYMVQVNITDGVLLPGLLSPEFPPMLVDVELSTANLRALPDDLDTKWSTGGALMFEYSEFTSIPDVVKRLLPPLLSFCGTRSTKSRRGSLPSN